MCMMWSGTSGPSKTREDNCDTAIDHGVSEPNIPRAPNRQQGRQYVAQQAYPPNHATKYIYIYNPVAILELGISLG